ncbi:PKD domain-containing protein, partial [bacterium]|nr:PKD domain-containing protein [bacterium]
GVLYDETLYCMYYCGYDGVNLKIGYAIGQGVPGLVAYAGPDVNICSGTCTTLNGSASGGAPGYTYSWSPDDGSLSDTSDSNPTVCPDTTTTYTLTVTDSNGCTGTDQAIITVNLCDTSCTVTANAGPDDTVCSGDCAALNGSAAVGDGNYTYLWTPGEMTDQNPTVCPTATTTYILTVTDSNGCSNQDQVTVTVNQSQVTPDFDAVPTIGPAPLSVSFSNLSTGSILSCLWDFGDGDESTFKNPAHTYNNPGIYTVSLTVSDTCGSDSKDISVTVGEHVLDASDATLISEDGKTRIDLDAGDLGTDGWIVVNQNPKDTTGVMPGGYYQLGQTVIELAALLPKRN